MLQNMQKAKGKVLQRASPPAQRGALNLRRGKRRPPSLYLHALGALSREVVQEGGCLPAPTPVENVLQFSSLGPELCSYLKAVLFSLYLHAAPAKYLTSNHSARYQNQRGGAFESGPPSLHTYIALLDNTSSFV
jgi:hypothetical protein